LGKGSGEKGLECQDSALFSSGTRAGGALSEIAHRGFRAAQSLRGRGRGRGRGRQVGLGQQSRVFPGARTITGLWLQLLLSIQGPLVCFLLLRELTLCPRGIFRALAVLRDV